MTAGHLPNAPMPTDGHPICDLTEISRYRSVVGSTVVVYEGSDGNTYHKLIEKSGTTWLLTRGAETAYRSTTQNYKDRV
jgi:hypothetical protein